jgi:hypothetical protein
MSGSIVESAAVRLDRLVDGTTSSTSGSSSLLTDVVITEDHTSTWIKILRVTNLTILGYEGKMISLLDVEHLICVVFTKGGRGSVIDERVIIQEGTDISDYLKELTRRSREKKVVANLNDLLF